MMKGFVISVSDDFPPSVAGVIRQSGAKFSDTVERGVTHLIVRNFNEMSDKMQSAFEFDVEIVDESFLHRVCSANGREIPADVLEQKPDFKDWALDRKWGAKRGREDDGDVGEPDRKQVKQPLDEPLPPRGVAEPKVRMNDGDVVEVQGSTSNYEIHFSGGVYYCTCIAWKMQKRPVDKRSCKHLRAYLGEEFERQRLGGVAAPTPAPRTVKNLANIERANKAGAPKVLLAHKWDEDKHDPQDWWISEKFDGVRAYWDGSNFMSRLGNAFYAPEFFKEGLPDNVHLDGELFMGRKMFQSTVSVVKSQDMSERWRDLTFMVFDIPSLDKPFEERVAHLKQMFANHPFVRIVEHTKCQGKPHLLKKLAEMEAQGAEGLMLRKPRSRYERTRSSTLLKVKSFEDDEAIVVGYEPGKGKYLGMTGSLIVKNGDGKKFKVGSGMSDADRTNPPKVGTKITYRFQELTKAGKPRFPTFVGIAIDK
jgi:DNA ligase-1